MNRNTENRKHQKKMIQKATCILLTFAIMITGIPLKEISELASEIEILKPIQAILPDFEGVDDFRGILFKEPETVASATDIAENMDRSATTINITSKADLIAYANGTYADHSTNEVLGYRHDDILSISFTDQTIELTSSDGFTGIGTASAPFAGTVQIGNVTQGDPYGELGKVTLSDVSLFDYISSDASFIDPSNNNTPVLLNGRTGSVPLFAHHVTSGSNPQTWNLAVDVKVTINNVDTFYTTGGLIGQMDENANAIVNVNFISSSSTESSDNVGAVCGTMKPGSSLELSISGTSTGNVSTATNDKHAGGLVGSMESGSTLTITGIPVFGTARSILATGNNAYAGGLVGKCDNATVIFSNGASYNDTANNTITGKIGAGGIFGYYGVSEGDIVSIDSSAYSITGTNEITASGQSVGGLIGVLRNNGTVSAPTSITISNGMLKSKLTGSNSGGLIGKYDALRLENSLTINSVTTDSVRTNGTYGGMIGYTENAYVVITGINSITVNGSGGYSGGLIGQIKNSFVDASGENVITTPNGGKIQAGVLHTMNDDSVICLSGITNISGASIGEANLIQARNSSLVYALGSGNDYVPAGDNTQASGWSYYRPDSNTSTFDDLNSWGQVIRLVKYNNSGTPAIGNLEDAGVVTADRITNHTVTLHGIAPSSDTVSIANSADFAKVALNVKLNNGTSPKTSGALRTEGDIYTSTILGNSNIELVFSDDVDLRGTGITGITRDFETDNDRKTNSGNGRSFLGTFDGNGHTLTLANGEAYGYRGTTDLTSADLSDSSKWGNTGAIAGGSNQHKFSGLFCDIGHKTDRNHQTYIKNLNINGSFRIYSNAERKIGGIASQMIGNTNIDNVSVTVDFTYYGVSSQNPGIGRFIGIDDDWEVMDSATRQSRKTLVIKDSVSGGKMNIAGKMSTNSLAGGSFGTLSRIENATDITVDGLTVTGEINTKITDNIEYYTYGGLVGIVFSNDTSANGAKPDQTFDLKNITIKDMSMACNTSQSKNKYCGGMLGGIWRGVTVLADGVTVNNSTITLGSTSQSQTVGGLVTQATGYWRVSGVSYSDFTIQKGPDAKDPQTIGLLVGEGWEPTGDKYNIETNRLYLEITDYGTSFTMNNLTVPANCTTFDELVGKTIKGTVGENGEGFVSIHTSSDKLNMINDSGNQYAPKTALGQSQVNPYTRYYYNLDYLLKNADTLSDDGYRGGAKFLLWSVYQYAAPNIQSNTNLTNWIKEKNDYNFGDYQTLPTESKINLEYLSYYPIDLEIAVSLTGKTITLNNKAMHNAHGTFYSTRSYSQHYLMHIGLFKDVKSNLTISNATICGNVGGYQNSSNAEIGSGALVCGKIQGSTIDKVNVTLNGLTLSNLQVHNLPENASSIPYALLIREVGSNNITSIKTVSTAGYSITNDETPIAAQALIGNAEGEQMSIIFSDMRLDARTSHQSANSVANALDTAYGTANSIFKTATFIQSLKYDNTKGSSAVYNYNYAEDWDASSNSVVPVHHVTYGQEISNSIEFEPDAGDDDQRRYLDMHATDDQNHWTSPTDHEADSVYDFSSGFLCYVGSTAIAGATGNTFHEVAVNHISLQLEEGCGTYNDPFIIKDGAILAAVAKALSMSSFSKGFALYIDNDYLESYDVNFEKWDSDKNGGTNHTRFEYDGNDFVGMKWDDNNDEWVVDSQITKKL